MEMSSTKTLTLLEQKRIQWAKEREEMVGLCGLWGHPKYSSHSSLKNENRTEEELQFRKNSILPPIPVRNESNELQKGHQICRPEEESETSGYLSDSPKHLNEKESAQDNRYKEENANSNWFEKAETRDNYSTDNNEEASHAIYSMDRKSYKNYKNERWAQHSSDSWHHQRSRNSKNWWFSTPESVSSDDGNRLRWGDRGVGIGHFWEPVVHQPDSRLPQLESYRPTPKWVERGLRQSDDSQKADILIIHHPDDDQYKSYSSDGQTQKSFILGQNVHLTPDVLEERERKRRRALEHQNAIRQQLEDRERKRKEERLNKLREERLEEERIKREQETERLRMEEEQRRNREREEKEKRKEEAMKEAIEQAERKAKEERRHQRKHAHLREEEQSVCTENTLDSEEGGIEKKSSVRTPKSRQSEVSVESRIKTSRTEKVNTERRHDYLAKIKSRKDSSSQFEQMRIPNGVQFLNMNNMPMDGSLALVLDNPTTENSFLLSSEGVQLALLMSPGSISTSQIIPVQTPIPTTITPRGRILTPSKFRLDGSLNSQRDKITQTDGLCCTTSVKYTRNLARNRKHGRRSGRISGCSDSSEKSNSLERPHAHYNSTIASKHRSRSQPRYSIDDRPKWGINRPSVQYKKQSEKDLCYQKKIKQRLKKMNDACTSTDTSPKVAETTSKQVEEKLLESEMRLLKCASDEDVSESKTRKQNESRTIEKEGEGRGEKHILRNGFRMNSNPSSPFFVPIDTERTEKSEEGQEFVLELTIDSNMLKNEVESMATPEENEDVFEDTAVPGSVGFVTQSQLEAIRQIASLREGLQKLHTDFSSSRSITPYSEKNE